jgi:hypothetical protein
LYIEKDFPIKAWTDNIKHFPTKDELRAFIHKFARTQPFTPSPFDPVRGGGLGFRLNHDQEACGRARIGFYAFMCLAETFRT